MLSGSLGQIGVGAYTRVLELLLIQCRTRNSPLWADDPRQQIAYLAVKRWTRLHCPDVLLGVYTPDELDEISPKNMGFVEVIIPPALLSEAEGTAAKGVAAYQTFWKDTGKENRHILAAKHDDFKAQALRADRSRTVDNNQTSGPKPATDASNDAPTGATDVRAKPDMKTLEGVLAAMRASQTEDALSVATDWGSILKEPEEQKAVAKLYDELLPKFRGA